MKHIQYYFIE